MKKETKGELKKENLKAIKAAELLKFNTKFKMIKEKGINEEKISFTDWLRAKETEMIANKQKKKEPSYFSSNSINNINSNYGNMPNKNKLTIGEKNMVFNKTFIKRITPDLKT